MKTVLVRIATPGDGDLVIIEAAPAGGGRNGAKHSVKGPRIRPKLDAEGFATDVEDVPADTPQTIATELASQINTEWLPECAQAVAKDGMLVIKCTDLFSDVTFTTHVQGVAGTTMSMEEF